MITTMNSNDLHKTFFVVTIAAVSAAFLAAWLREAVWNPADRFDRTVQWAARVLGFASFSLLIAYSYSVTEKCAKIEKECQRLLAKKANSVTEFAAFSHFETVLPNGAKLTWSKEHDRGIRSVSAAERCFRASSERIECSNSAHGAESGSAGRLY